ncbi:MAG: DUF1738 domain-containing protein [bacterium]|nr:DUF1738 domain-containing protein [bacterium]
MKSKKADVYEMVTNQFIECLESGFIPWKKTWTTGMGSQQNFKTRKPYSLLNSLLLTMIASEKGYKSLYWLTFNQAKELKGTVKRGEKGQFVIFWKMFEKENASGEIETFPVLRYYKVFNIEQTTLELPKLEEKDIEEKEILDCENLIGNYNEMPEILYGDPAYSPGRDKIYMPYKAEFENIEEYYFALFHETVHSTGSKKRLNRNLLRLGKENRSLEELTAEIGASLLANLTGMQEGTTDNEKAYIQSWIKTFKNDKRMIVQAASAAQKAVNYIQENSAAAEMPTAA